MCAPALGADAAVAATAVVATTQKDAIKLMDAVKDVAGAAVVAEASRYGYFHKPHCKYTTRIPPLCVYRVCPSTIYRGSQPFCTDYGWHAVPGRGRGSPQRGLIYYKQILVHHETPPAETLSD